MQAYSRTAAFILGVFICLGLVGLGYMLGSSAIEFKQHERTVIAKGLAEQEYAADLALWPIQFTTAHNDLAALYEKLEHNTGLIVDFLRSSGFDETEITVAAPAITDKLAQQYGNNVRVEFRYTAMRTVTVYSDKVDAVRATISGLLALGKEGIVFTGGGHQNRTEFFFTRLNEVKPGMVEEATRKAREVAEKFARDSDSRLGKIRHARQGQFSISDRDKNTPHIKKVRVVSTVEYYLYD